MPIEPPRPQQKYSLHSVIRPYLKSSAYNSFLFITLSQQALLKSEHLPSISYV